MSGLQHSHLLIRFGPTNDFKKLRLKNNRGKISLKNLEKPLYLKVRKGKLEAPITPQNGISDESSWEN